MSERWRKPARIVAVAEDPQRIYHDGNVYRRQADITVDGDTLARMKLGYVCLRCYEPHEVPFPQLCNLCGYSMAEFQQRDLHEEFEGTKQVGPSTSIDDEVQRIREERLRDKWLPGTSRSSASIPGLWTPPSAA